MNENFFLAKKELRMVVSAHMPWKRHSTKEQMRRFAHVVKRFRLMAGMTQRQLAKAMNVAPRTVQNIEAASNEPRYSVINAFNSLQRRYADANQVPPLAEAISGEISREMHG